MIKSSNSAPAGPLTTGIGSLPHTSSEEALNAAFSVDIPYFPTLPQGDPREGMLASALEGFPGVQPRGAEFIWEVRDWTQGREALEEELEEAANRNRYLDFLSTVSLDRWDEFCRRLGASQAALGKSQVTGPFTAALGLKGLQELPPQVQKEVVQALAGWIFAKAMAMVTGIRLVERRPLIFFDEPSWASWHAQDFLHGWIAEKFRELLEDLKNAGVATGIHCCARADLETWLSWDFDYLSVDCELSLQDVLGAPGLQSWMSRGGRLSLGIVPTSLPKEWDGSRETRKLLERFETEGKARALRECLLTPACGLGMRDDEAAKRVFKALADFKEILVEKLA